MIFDPDRHEALDPLVWDEAKARAFIERTVRDCERRFDSRTFWPLHPKDADDGAVAPAPPLYHGACGVVWALRYLDAAGAVAARRSFDPHLEAIRAAIVAWLGAFGAAREAAAYLMGETPLLMLRYGRNGDGADGERLAALIAGNIEHPAREVMWGAPGTMLAALLLFRRTGEPHWAELFRASARALWSQLAWSEQHGCRYWVQDLYGRRSTYIDAVHGFVGTAAALIRGRDLLPVDEWARWQACIVETVARTATHEGPLANWRACLDPPQQPNLMQYCHGAPGFVVCLDGFPGSELDALLVAGGEATWAAGPLRKGASLCHGTAGNGYAFLKLHARTGDAVWLARARAFAMHAIAQAEADAANFGALRYSLWTGDPGVAIYVWDCLRGVGAFPTVDAFYAD